MTYSMQSKCMTDLLLGGIIIIECLCNTHIFDYHLFCLVPYDKYYKWLVNGVFYHRMLATARSNHVTACYSQTAGQTQVDKQVRAVHNVQCNN